MENKQKTNSKMTDIRNLYTTQGAIKKIKINITAWKRIFANHIPYNKSLIKNIQPED